MIVKQRLISILIMVALMISAILIVDTALMSRQQTADLGFEAEDFSPSIPTEEGVFKRAEFAMYYENMPEDEKYQNSLKEYYSRRAFPGAPPVIPHPLVSEKGIGGNDCLQCHKNGGFVPKFEAYAPVTPHPEMLNCKQCHVPAAAVGNFKMTNWEKFDHPEIGNQALIGSPPVIPHGLQMRENCLACHAGPAAPKEIRVSHPSRVNCRQCHVPVEDAAEIQLGTEKVFSRKPN